MATPTARPSAHAPVPASVPVRPTTSAKPAPTTSEVQLTQRVLADLQRQVELMLEVRLREALAPVLARAADALIRDARKELTTTLRDAVARSVAQALARRDDD